MIVPDNWTQTTTTVPRFGEPVSTWKDQLKKEVDQDYQNKVRDISSLKYIATVNLSEDDKEKISEKIKEGFLKQYSITKQAGEKYNSNKLPMSLLFKQFPDALQAVMLCSEYGHIKYPKDTDYLNFKRVYGGSKTYEDALVRHFLGGEKDKDSGLPEQFHRAWNAMAALQLWIEEQQLDIKDFSEKFLKSKRV